MLHLNLYNEFEINASPVAMRIFLNGQYPAAYGVAKKTGQHGAIKDTAMHSVRSNKNHAIMYSMDMRSADII
ncbi:unnamed protein product [Cylicocyclus nassatus]|uniref:Uncharacterized protein n=1 Tax=Cylicocyclus nassatus TaxID=53992 RepID=A0AA36GT18_CYLNA|nr:unnamed protein product [Cylicocyclus nassatus]